MMRVTSFLAVIFLVIATPTPVSAVDRGQPLLQSPQAPAGLEAAGPVQISIDPATGTPSFVRILDGGLRLEGADPATKARDFLTRFSDAYGLSDPDSNLELIRSRTDRLGKQHLSFVQRHRGVPVFAAALKAHFDEHGDLYAVNGTLVPRLEVDTIPSVTVDVAVGIARQWAAKRHGMPPGNLDAAEIELVVYRTGLIRGIDGTNHLTWKIEVVDGLGGIRETLFVDAHDGVVLDRIDEIHRINRQIHHRTFPRSIWNEGDPVPFSDPDFTSQQNDEVNLLIDVSADTYAFFSNISGGEFLSFDGNDRTMNAVYEAVFNPPCNESINASWNGVTTNFCVGLAVDDVIAHEWTHGYTDWTHDLIYAWQPGALNEAYSDIFGEVVDLINGRGFDEPDNPRSPGGCSSFFGNPLPSLSISSPTSIAGDFDARGGFFNPDAPWSASDFVELVHDGTGTATDACEPLQGFTSGRLALIDRGECSFITKAINAADAGAAGIIIANNDGDNLLIMGGTRPTGYDTPAVFVAQSTGDTIKSALDQGVQATIALTEATDNSVRWLVSEDGAAGAFRDMWNPNCMGHPGRVSDPSYFCFEDDGGGVHSNSGVPNHAFALLVDGGTYNGVTVNAIGLTRAAHLYWRAMREYQVPTSKFADHADLLELSCEDLRNTTLTDLSTGEAISQVIRATDCAQVEAAMLATEMRLAPTQCGFEAILDPAAPELGATTVVYEETFDNAAALDTWTLSNSGVYPEYDTDRNWRVTTFLPADRDGGGLFAINNSFIGNCQPNDDDQSGVLMAESPAISLPSSSSTMYLLIEHYVATEKGWDGGNFKISVNGGEYQLVPESAFAFNPYNDEVIYSTLDDQQNEVLNDNPLAGEPAFTGVDQGEVQGSWGQSQIDLDELAEPGDSIRVRFDFGNDGCTGVEGWYIDQMKVVTGGQPELSVLRPSRRIAP